MIENYLQKFANLRTDKENKGQVKYTLTKSGSEHPNRYIKSTSKIRPLILKDLLTTEFRSINGIAKQ